jgi:hypothetical protein
MERVLSAVALVASFVALGVSVTSSRAAREKDAKKEESALGKYDLSTPSSAYFCTLRMAATNDRKAIEEFDHLTSKAELEEQSNTLTFVKQVEHKGQVLLFIRYNRQGVPKQTVERMEKDARSGLWVPKGGFYFVSKEDGAVGEQVNAWTGNK